MYPQSSFGQPLYWDIGQRPDAFTLDPWHPYSNGNVFAGLARHTGTTLFPDSAPYASNGLLSGNYAWTNDIGRSAVGYTGGSSSFSLAGPGGLKQMSLCGWAKPASGVNSYMLYRNYGGASEYRFGFLFLKAGALYYLYALMSFGSNSYGTCGYFRDVTHHYALVFNGDAADNAGRLKIYINAIPQTLTFTGTIPAVTTPIGKLASGIGTATQSDLLVYNRVLSQPELNALARPDNAMFSLGGSDPGWLIPDDMVFPVYLPSGATPAAAKPALWMGVCV